MWFHHVADEATILLTLGESGGKLVGHVSVESETGQHGRREKELELSMLHGYITFGLLLLLFITTLVSIGTCVIFLILC